MYPTIVVPAPDVQVNPISSGRRFIEFSDDVDTLLFDAQRR
jgi:hypothetical protein